MGRTQDFTTNETSSYAEVTALADILANFHDWDSANPAEEAADLISNSFPEVEPTRFRHVINAFLAIPPSERFGPSFNHSAFVESALRVFSK